MVQSLLLETDSEVGGGQNQLPCREDFFREEGSNDCVPSCYTWQEYSQTEAIVTDVIMIGANVIGLVAGIIVIAFSIFRRKKMLEWFPVTISSFNFANAGGPSLLSLF